MVRPLPVRLCNARLWKRAFCLTLTYVYADGINTENPRMNLSKLTQPLFDKSADAGGNDQTDDGTGADTSEKAGKPKVEFTKEQQDEINRIIADRLSRKEAQLKADAEAKAKADKEAAEKKALEDQGEYKKLAEAEQKKTLEAETRAKQAEAKAQRLELQRRFEASVSEMGVKFVNAKAAEDAFLHLDAAAVGEDFTGMEVAVKKLIEDRDYFFEEVPAVGQNIDATSKGKVSQRAAKETIIKKKRSSYSTL